MVLGLPVVVQWLRLPLSIQVLLVWSLVRELRSYTSWGAAKIIIIIKREDSISQTRNDLELRFLTDHVFTLWVISLPRNPLLLRNLYMFTFQFWVWVAAAQNISWQDAFLKFDSPGAKFQSLLARSAHARWPPGWVQLDLKSPFLPQNRCEEVRCLGAKMGSLKCCWSQLDEKETWGWKAGWFASRRSWPCVPLKEELGFFLDEEDVATRNLALNLKADERLWHLWCGLFLQEFKTKEAGKQTVLSLGGPHSQLELTGFVAPDRNPVLDPQHLSKFDGSCLCSTSSLQVVPCNHRSALEYIRSRFTV